jgi:nicotinate-nucleotide--dimethylbenzimidazole phosphoribosyltransferase
LVFAGSHGIAAHGVSAFPAEVTAQMVANFQAGGAAINQLSKTVGATLDVILLSNGEPTADFTRQPAMTEDEFIAAIETGFNAVASDADLICLGEMGIGNTTTAATLCAALFGGRGADWAGRGTGVDDEGLKRKARVIDAALVTHAEALSDPLEVLRRMGGRELVAIFGAVLAAREKAVPILLDGFVSTASVAALAKLSDSGLEHALAGHVSAEAQHGRLLRHLRMTPLLDLGMRLGEASGACVAVGLLRAAVACHTGMATFAEAGVSEA